MPNGYLPLDENHGVEDYIPRLLVSKKEKTSNCEFESVLSRQSSQFTEQFRKHSSGSSYTMETLKNFEEKPLIELAETTKMETTAPAEDQRPRTETEASIGGIIGLSVQRATEMNKKSSKEKLVQDEVRVDILLQAQAPVPPFVTYRPFSSEQFLAVVEEVKAAIASGVQPTRIEQGSSGSYFCRNRNGQIVGVFKPKNEEPYGHLNPKWTKWLHKTCCPCCFGRSCLIPNLGYISEAGASVVDRHLELGVVPRTEVISLSSTSFYYSYLDKRHAARNNGVYPPKVGSFQLFMHGYMDATKFLREGPNMIREGRLPRDDETGGLHPMAQQQFQAEFENLIILDYIIRNTDRGLDNWMVRVEDSSLADQISMHSRKTGQATNNHRISSSGSDNSTEQPPTLASTDALKSVASWDMNSAGGGRTAPLSENDEVSSQANGLITLPNETTPSLHQQPSQIHIAAIDNGLAFPFKHPDKWRSYPYGWASLPAARVPFSQATRDKLIPLLTSRLWWDELIKDLRTVFSIDADFDEKLFRRQIAVMKGQVYNLVQVLKMGQSAPYSAQHPNESPSHSRPPTVTEPLNLSKGYGGGLQGTPYDLVLQPPCLVWEDDDIRDLVQGNFGVDFAGKDGVLATIIGGIDAVIHPDKHKKNPNAHTKPRSIPSSPRVKNEPDGGFLSGSPVAESSKMAAELGEHTEGEEDGHVNERKKHGIRQELDAFRGRVITFVKGQPWISWW